jgi:hypothetical protein
MKVSEMIRKSFLVESGADLRLREVGKRVFLLLFNFLFFSSSFSCE